MLSRTVATADHADLCHPMPRRVPFTAAGWIFELKHDGFRAFVRRDKTGVQVLSRSGRPMADAFPEVVAAVAKLPGRHRVRRGARCPQGRQTMAFR